MFKKLISKLLDYVAYIILGVLGLGIFNTLYVLSFTETGRALLSIFIVFISIFWAIIRVLKKR